MPRAGTFVEYRLEGGPSAGQYRPALVVRVWTEACAQLQVFADKVNDGPDPFDLDWFRSSVSFGADPGTWRPLPGVFEFFANPSVVAGGAIPANRCNCTDNWFSPSPRPPCPQHGWSVTAQPAGPYMGPTPGYPR